jgi:hypothetical protein
VEATREQLSQAQAQLGSDRHSLDAADIWMLASIADFNELSSRLENAAFAFAQLQEDVLANEVDLSVRKVEVSWLIRDAYADSMLAGPAAPLTTTVIDEVLLAADILGRIASLRSRVAQDFAKSREQLTSAREQMLAARDVLTQLTDQASARVDHAVREANSAALQVNAATERERQAAALYQDAVDRLEAALRSVPPRVLRWRPLVMKYFPEELQWQALEVILCESSGREQVKNDSENAVGLFQFLPGVWEEASEAAGFPGADRTDPEASIAAAAWLVQKTIGDNHPDGPWGRWNCKPWS